MYIENISKLKTPIYTCSFIIGKYLSEKRSIPVLSIKNGTWYFSKTLLLEEVLDSMPLYLKILDKI